MSTTERKARTMQLATKGLADAVQYYMMEHGADEPHIRCRPVEGVCSYCGEFIDEGERYFRGSVLRSGSDRFELVILHKECLFDYVVSRYDEAELATALGLMEVY